MKHSRRSRIILLALTLPQLVLPPTTTLAGVFDWHKGAADGPITLKEAACYVDCIDKRLFATGTIGVKTPDVWGQNRMTVYRAEYEGQMKSRLDQFQVYLQAAQDRTDLSALTSATSLGASIAAVQSKGSPAAAAKLATPATPVVNTMVVAPSATPAATPAATTPATPAGPGNPDFTGMQSQLDAISKRIDTLKSGTLTLPSNINTFVTKAGTTGVGIEPTVALDEEANYINHLHQLRRVNAGDDLTDLAGYGLYLLRMPVSVMPGPESRKGKGAIVTVEARHDLTDDLLPNTFRDVAVLDLTYALTQIVNEDIHQDIFDACHPIKPKDPTKPDPTKKAMMLSQFDVPKNVSGPNAFLLEDLRIILGPLDQPTESELWLEDHPNGEQPATGGDLVPPPPSDGRSAFDRVPSGEAAEPAKRLMPPVPPTPYQVPPTTTSTNRAKPTGRGIVPKRDEIVKTRFQAPAAIDPTRRYRAILSDRLDLLVRSMEESQRDPYRHDPSTLSLFQASIMDAYRYMRQNAQQNALFQVPRIEELGELLLRRDYKKLKDYREQFLYELCCYRQGASLGRDPSFWTDLVEPSDVLAFALLLQFVNVDRQIKFDMKYMAQRRGCNCGEVEGLCFYEFDASLEARNAFKDYVACKWPLHIYAVDPVLDQQNVLDAYSRRTELQLALAVAVSTGQFNIKNATSFARQLDLDLQTVGLNRTSVGFGAGDTTFGWMFYPRVQTPQPVSNFRTITNTLTGTGQGINADLRSRRIEPGQRECIALMVTPNFIPSIKVSTVTNWFDVTGHHAKQQLSNQEMLESSRKLQQAKAAVARACDSHEYRATDFTVLNQRIKQLEALLPTQDTRVDLPDEGDLLGSEIFSSNAAGLSPSLLAWYGEPVQDGTAGSIFLQGRGFSVSETQVIVGGIPLQQGSGFRLISRNVMQVIVPATARSVPIKFEQNAGAAANSPAAPVAVATVMGPGGVPTFEARGGVADLQVADDQRVKAQLDPTLSSDVNVTLQNGNTSANARGSKIDIQLGGVHARAQGTPAKATAPTTLPCDRAVIDVHIATPNGISNHLYVEVVPKSQAATKAQNAVTTATTKTTVNGNTTTTSTRFETTPPGTVLPPLTVLPLGTNWPPNTMLAPGPVTGAAAGSLLPGLVPSPASPPAGTPLSLTPAATPAATAATTPAATTPPAASAPASGTTAAPAPVPPAAPAAPAAAPAAPAPAAPAPAGLPAPRASSTLPAWGSDGQVVATASLATSLSGLPPLPAEVPKVAAAQPDASATRRVRPPVLRRIGLPDR